MAELSALEAMDRYSALGPEFLTWLAVHSQADDLPQPPTEPGLQVAILGPLQFVSSGGEATKVTLAGDEAAASPVVATALRAGKRLGRAKVSFTAVDATWIFTLDGETFDLKSVKLPVPKISDLDEYMSQRVQALQHLWRLVEELFEIFLQVRLDPEAWKAEAASWREIA